MRCTAFIKPGARRAIYEYQTSADVRPAPATYHIPANTQGSHYPAVPSAKTLATGYVLKESRRITPDAVRRTHIHRSIKLPAGPGSLSRRISRTMEKV